MTRMTNPEGMQEFGVRRSTEYGGAIQIMDDLIPMSLQDGGVPIGSVRPSFLTTEEK